MKFIYLISDQAFKADNEDKDEVSGSEAAERNNSELQLWFWCESALVNDVGALNFEYSKE